MSNESILLHKTRVQIHKLLDFLFLKDKRKYASTNEIWTKGNIKVWLEIYTNDKLNICFTLYQFPKYQYNHLEKLP